MAVKLRDRAEELIRTEVFSDDLVMSSEEFKKTLHELRVHQIELEMQNEELRQKQVELDASRARYFELYDLAPVGYATISEQGLIIEANLTLATMVGVARGAFVSMPISRLIFTEDQDKYYSHRKKLMNTGEPQNLDVRMVKACKSVFWANLRATVAQNREENPVCRIAMSDITDQKQTEKMLEDYRNKLEQLSLTDGLTGIPNRRKFDEVLNHEYARHARSGDDLSLVMLDIDFFKAYNDSYGHTPGDKVLQNIADIISKCAARPADLIARYGGEEFMCILPGTGSPGAVGVAEDIRKRILARAMLHNNSSVSEFVTASFGVLTIKCKLGVSVEMVLTQVDSLLYQAKLNGRNRIEFNSLQ